MKMSKRILAVLLSVLLILPSFAVPFAFAEGEAEGETPVAPVDLYANADPSEEYYVVGRFQEKGTKVEGASEVTENTGDNAETFPNSVTMGNVRVKPAAPIDLTGRNLDDLAVAFDITYTRGDGKTGAGVLNYTGNQMLFLNSENSQKYRFIGQPYLTGVTSNYADQAGKTVSYLIPLNYVWPHNGTSTFKTDDSEVTALDELFWQVYNDSWKQDIDGNGLMDDAYELQIAIENARIIDTTRDGEGYKHGIVATWSGADPVVTENATGQSPVTIFPWSDAKTNVMTSEMDPAKLLLSFDAMIEGNFDPAMVKNGEVRLHDGTNEWNISGWANGKTPKTGTWYHFEWKLSEFKRTVQVDDGNGGTKNETVYLTDVGKINRFYIFNYNDNAGKPAVTASVKNVKVEDLTVTGPRKDLEAAVAELANSVFEEDEKAVVYDAAVAAGKALLADRDAAPADMTEATEAIAAAKAELTGIVDMSVEVMGFAFGTKTFAYENPTQYTFDWTSGDKMNGNTGVSLSDDGATIGANRYMEGKIIIKANPDYTGTVEVQDLENLIKKVDVRPRTNVDGEKRTNSYTATLETPVDNGDGTYTVGWSVLFDASQQHEIDWTNVRQALVYVQTNEPVREAEAAKNSDAAVFLTMDEANIRNYTAPVMVDALNDEATAAVDGYEANEALTAYTEAQDAAMLLLSGDYTVRQVKAALANLTTLKKTLTEKVVKADLTALTTAIADGEAKVADDKTYTEDTLKALTDAIAAGKLLTEDDTQEDVNAAAKAITDAIAGLEEVVPPAKADLTALTTAIADGEAKVADDKTYTEDTLKALTDAIAAGKLLTEDDTQEDVDAAAKAITDAIAGLEEVVPPAKADLTALNAAIEAGEAKLQDGKTYTEDTLKALTDAIAAGKLLTEDDTQADVDAAAKAITDAITGLVEDIPEEPVTIEDLTAAVAEATATLADGVYENAGVKALEASIAAAQALIDAAADEDPENDPDEDALKAAIADLEEKAAALVEIDLTGEVTLNLIEETTTPALHTMNILVPNVELTKYGVRESYKVKVTFTVNKDEATFGNLAEDIQALPTADLVKWIENGRIRLHWGTPDEAGQSAQVDILTGLNYTATDYGVDVSYTADIPAEVVDYGSITMVEVFIYNNLQNAGSDNNSDGFTVTFKEVALQLGALKDTGKTGLLALLQAQKTGEDLEGYTATSVYIYNKLFEEAQAIYDDAEATEEDVARYVAVLEGAASVLKLDATDPIEAPVLADPVTGAARDFMEVAKNFDTPIDLTAYGDRESVKLLFKVRVDKSDLWDTIPEAMQNLTPEEIIKYVVNGSVNLWGATANDADQWKGNDAGIRISLGQGDYASAILGGEFYVEIDVPQVILDAGMISRFQIYFYNDMHNLDNTLYTKADDVGLQLTVSEMQVLFGAAKAANKTELKELLTSAESFVPAEDADPALVAELAEAIEYAKVVEGDAAASQDDVDAAALLLSLWLSEFEPEVEMGDVDGNGEVLAADALLALQIATQKIVAEDAQIAAADVNLDGEVTPADALLILQFATKKISEF